MAITLNGTNGVDTPGLVVDTDTLYVDKANNRVGIGTNSPTDTLSVRNSTNGVDLIGFSGGGGGGEYKIKSGSTNVGWFGGGLTSTLYLGAAANIPLDFYTNNTARMRITADGNVGIGTSSPSSILEVNKSVAGDTTIKSVNSNSSGVAEFGAYGSGVTQAHFLGTGNIGGNQLHYLYGSGNFPQVFFTNATERMRITADGNVGIGGSPAGGAYKVDLISNSTSGTGSYYRTYNAATGAGSESGIVVQNNYNSSGVTANLSTYNDSAFVNVSSNHPLQFRTNNTERMRITADGNVGIGTSSPASKFHVNGGAAVLSNADATEGGEIQFLNPGTEVPGLYVDVSVTDVGRVWTARNNSVIEIGQLVGTGGRISFMTETTERMRITAAGEVMIAGTTDRGAFNLQCNGTGVWGAGAYTNGSDARIKEDITPLTSGLDVVSKLNPVTYRYKEDWSKDQSIQTGFVAQDLLEALDGTNYVDGVVTQGGPEGYYSVAYQNIIPILTKAIQEQQNIINDLKSRIEALENV